MIRALRTRSLSTPTVLIGCALLASGTVLAAPEIQRATPRTPTISDAEDLKLALPRASYAGDAEVANLAAVRVSAAKKKLKLDTANLPTIIGLRSSAPQTYLHLSKPHKVLFDGFDANSPNDVVRRAMLQVTSSAAFDFDKPFGSVTFQVQAGRVYVADCPVLWTSGAWQMRYTPASGGAPTVIPAPTNPVSYAATANGKLEVQFHGYETNQNRLWGFEECRIKSFQYD